MSTTTAFILSTIAGLSTLIGTTIIFIFKKKTDKIITFSLAFASGVMICVSLTDLIPESINLINNTLFSFPTILITSIFISLGILLSIFINKTLPNDKDKLYKVGIFSMIAIILHNIPEGIATFITSTNQIALGISLTIAIALHNIPEGISISVPIYYSTGSKKKAFLYTLLSGLSEPFGALIAFLFLQPYVNDLMLGFVFAIIAGIMLHISFYELLPTSLNYKNKKLTSLAFILGVLVMLLNLLFSI